MGLNFKKWLLEKLGGGTEKTKSIDIDWTEFFSLMDNAYIRELAFWTCVNKQNIISGMWNRTATRMRQLF